MKKILALILFAPFALNAIGDDLPTFFHTSSTVMDAAQKPKPIYIYPILNHARADKGQATVASAYDLYASSASTYIETASSYARIGFQARGTELKILEIIPNTERFIVLYSFKKNKDVSPSLGVAITQYNKDIPMGDETSGVQYLLRIPSKDSCKLHPSTEDLSDTAQEFLATSGLTLASNTNNNNNQ